MRRHPDGVDRSLQTHARAKPGRAEGGAGKRRLGADGHPDGVDRSLQTHAQAKPGRAEGGAGKRRLGADGRIGEIYLTADEIRARVGELGAELAADYAGREPLLVALLKASVVFVADLSRAIPIVHHLDFVELAGYGGAGTGGHSRIRLLKDLDVEIEGRDIVIVEDVVDTGLTLYYLCRTLGLRRPGSLAAITLLDRPYRRLVNDLPVRYVGFTVPDEVFVGYGFDLDERFRNLPDLHLVRAGAHGEV